MAALKNEIIQTSSDNLFGLAWMLTFRLASGVLRFNCTLTSSSKQPSLISASWTKDDPMLHKKWSDCTEDQPATVNQQIKFCLSISLSLLDPKRQQWQITPDRHNSLTLTQTCLCQRPEHVWPHAHTWDVLLHRPPSWGPRGRETFAHLLHSVWQLMVNISRHLKERNLKISWKTDSN